MSYQEKRTLVSVLTGILILAAYCIYTYSKVSSGVESVSDLKFWAFAMVLFIGIGVIATIIIQIVFHILLSVGLAIKEQIQTGGVDEDGIEKILEVEMVEDEMDKLIGLKSMRFGFAIAGIGFVSGLLTLLFDYAPAVMLNIMFVSFSLGSILEGIVQIYYYRKGVNHG
jgi:hypothetical protein